MKRIVFLLLVSLQTFTASFAQKLTVESLKALPNDISASQYEKKDLNGIPCALLKIQMVDDILRIEGNVIDDVVNRGTEKWIYLTAGTKEMKIVPKNHLPLSITFSDYGIVKLDSKATYSLMLTEEVVGKDAPLVFTTDGPNEVDLDEIANHMFGIQELKPKEKFKKAEEAITALYPQAKVEDEGQSKVIVLDSDCGYNKTLLAQPLSVKAQWISVMKMLGVGSSSVQYSISLPVDKDTAMEVVKRVAEMFEAKGYKISDPSGIYKSAAAGYDYYKNAKKKSISMTIALGQISPNNYILYILSM